MRLKRILLVDDNDGDEELVRAAVRKEQIACELAVVKDGLEAIEYLSGLADSDLPALVLVDIMMPRIDGLALLGRVRAHPRLRMLPVVMFSSSNAERDLTDSYASGCNGYVRKPLEFTKFCEVVRDLARYWLGWNEAPPPPPVIARTAALPSTSSIGDRR